MKNTKIVYVWILLLSLIIVSCEKKIEVVEETTETVEEIEETKEPVNTTDPILVEKIYIDFTNKYATYSIINDGYATLYRHNPDYVPEENVNMVTPLGITVAVNAGHGTKDGSRVKTFSHPDFSKKVTSATEAEGSILTYAISEGMSFLDGTREADANLKVAMALKEKLLNAGYDVLMIRENNDARLDNIARTVIANNNADCHIALHFNSTSFDSGIFYITPYKNETYLNMEPLKSNVENIRALGKSIINAFNDMGERVWKSGMMAGDLTQLSYSTNASIDLELGDKATVLTDERVESLTEGIKRGLDNYFGVKR